MTERLTVFTRRICKDPIPLEECESRTPLGYPVHKNCYSKLMMEEKQKRKAAGRSS
jgi:hypothetical protein